MSLKAKKKPYHFTFQTVLRLAIFTALIYFLISLLSQQKPKNFDVNDPTVLGDEIENSTDSVKLNLPINDLYQKIPEDSRKKIEGLNKNSTVLYLQDKFNYLKSQSNGFPQKQIKDVKKMLLKNAYDDMIKSIDKE